MKTIIIGVSAVSLIVITVLSFQILKKDKPKFSNETITGDWKEIDGYAHLSIKADNTFKFSPNYRMDFSGTWAIKDIILSPDTTSLLILKNSEKIKDSRDDYSHYFYKIEKVSKEKIKLIDLTGESRRNRVSVFERNF